MGREKFDERHSLCVDTALKLQKKWSQTDEYANKIARYYSLKSFFGLQIMSLVIPDFIAEWDSFPDMTEAKFNALVEEMLLLKLFS